MECKTFFATSIISRYPTESIGKHTVHITEKTKLFNEPEKEHKILGISNEKGMFDAYVELGKTLIRHTSTLKMGAWHTILTE